MWLGSVATSVSALALVLGCGHGSVQQKPPEASATTSAPNDGGAENLFRSTRYRFHWRIPSDWKFVPLDELGMSDLHPAVEAVAASARSDDELLILQVTDVVAVVPGKEPTLDAKAREDYASSWMQSAGVRKTGSSRLRILGTDAIRVDGELDEAQGALTHATMVMFYRNRRSFVLRCYAPRHELGTPCDDALRELVIDEMPDSPEPGDRPRVLHLREAKYRLQFDAPDDSWLAIGPRIGGGGQQIVWIWNKQGHQLDVQVLDLANFAIDEATFVEKIADGHRKPDTTVTVKRSELSGRPCGHIELTRPQGQQQDLFLQKRGSLVYGLLVTAPQRDPALLARARAGFRIANPD